MNSGPTARDYTVARADPLFASASATEKHRLAQAAQLMRLLAQADEPNEHWLVAAGPVLRVVRFTGRGLSGRTIAALTKAGIDLPERVLFMSEDQIRALPGVGKLGFTELIAYRERLMVG